MDVREFIDKWRQSSGSERANKDSFLRDLCDVLGVPHPDPATGDSDRDRYVFERDAVLVHGGEKHTIGKIDLYKHGCFILEAKQGSEAGDKKFGTARRDTALWHLEMLKAYGQASNYASTIEPAPPFLIVTDIGYCFDLYASFDGSRRYQKFPDALNSRISFASVGEHLDTLRTIFTDPYSLDPSKRSARVTREIAGHLANLARSLEESGHAPELVAKFLMRCLFTMFAEDVGLLPKGIFADALREHWIESPDVFPGEVEALWLRMNEGGYMFKIGKIWQFNGGLFADPVALPLTKRQLIILGLAAEMNWSDVEPAIFGTLLERALDPKERHRLGAHYTPRAYVERLVRPTIEDPLREEWDNVRAQVLNIVSSADPENDRKEVAEARKIVYAFYDRLTRIRVLDPACGSGNFLFVALDLFKRIENEVIELLDRLGRDRAIITFGRMVTPEQFLGIEIKPWAKEITELVLWIGWLQWQIRTRGWASHPQEPILRDYHNIECRDAVLAYDRREPLLDDDGNPVTRWDGETIKVSPVTGEDIPDDTARVPVYRYVNPRKAEWPAAEYVVGNPPFIGDKMMKQALGSGYVEALRDAYPELSASADYVVYWWRNAAELVAEGVVTRFGFITTNSLRQTFNRRVIENFIDTARISLVFAIPDHPWVDEVDGADVRISMTVASRGAAIGVLQTIKSESVEGVELNTARGRINSDLRVGADLTQTTKLESNEGLSCVGVKLFGQGFLLTGDEHARLEAEAAAIIRPYLIARDLIANNPPRRVIDAFELTEADLRSRYPATYQHLREHVWPERITNARAAYRDRWWIFGEPRKQFRPALLGLPRFIVTAETAKHRFFVFLERQVLAEGSLVMFASADAFMLGVLSSRLHVIWALAAGGRLGIGNDPRYNKTRCFDPFPFPDPDEANKQRIRNLGEQLDAHRKRQQALHPDLTITGMYNVLEKLRAGDPLNEKEKKIHADGLVSVLKQIHEELDAAVFDAYGWPHDLTDEQILERLVALNAERAEEEKRGIVRWLRPEFQNPGGAGAAAQTTLVVAEAEEPAPVKAETPQWPKELPRQIAAVRDLVTSDRDARDWSAEAAAKAFKGARRKDVEAVLDSLAALGILVAFDTRDGKRWRMAA